MSSQIRKWDLRFLNLAKHISSWSKDPSTKVGAVIVDDNQRVISIGYNGFPVGVRDVKSRRDDRDTKLLMTVHAETNAILFAGSCNDMTVYSWPLPMCARCSANAIQSGIKRSVSVHPSKELKDRWSDDFNASKVMLTESGISVILYNNDLLNT